jgi:hypothetical protein
MTRKSNLETLGVRTSKFHINHYYLWALNIAIRYRTNPSTCNRQSQFRVTKPPAANQPAAGAGHVASVFSGQVDALAVCVRVCRCWGREGMGGDGRSWGGGPWG